MWSTMSPGNHRKHSSGGSPNREGPDLVLVVLVVLLILTLVAFSTGWIDYPVGVLVLAFLIVARVIQR